MAGSFTHLDVLITTLAAQITRTVKGSLDLGTQFKKPRQVQQLI